MLISQNSLLYLPFLLRFATPWQSVYWNNHSYHQHLPNWNAMVAKRLFISSFFKFWHCPFYFLSLYSEPWGASYRWNYALVLLWLSFLTWHKVYNVLVTVNLSFPFEPSAVCPYYVLLTYLLLSSPKAIWNASTSFSSETDSCYVAQASFKFIFLLSQFPSGVLRVQHGPPCLAGFVSTFAHFQGLTHPPSYSM